MFALLLLLLFYVLVRVLFIVFWFFGRESECEFVKIFRNIWIRPCLNRSAAPNSLFVRAQKVMKNKCVVFVARTAAMPFLFRPIPSGRFSKRHNNFSNFQLFCNGKRARRFDGTKSFAFLHVSLPVCGIRNSNGIAQMDCACVCICAQITAAWMLTAMSVGRSTFSTADVSVNGALTVLDVAAGSSTKYHIHFNESTLLISGAQYAAQIRCVFDNSTHRVLRTRYLYLVGFA